MGARIGRFDADRVGHSYRNVLIPYWWQNPTAFAELLDGRRRVQPSAAHAGRRAIAGDILRHVGGATITTPSRIALAG